MGIVIPSSEIKQPSFHADELGFVFVWKDHFLRGIYPKAIKQANGYFESGFINEIVDKGLFPKTWISEFENEQFGLIIEHEFIRPVIYATEWNFQMLKDAALMVLEIADVGRSYGYDMIDCHKLNVMFLHNRPVYVDLGSFIPADRGSLGWRPYNSFLRSYYYILDIWSKGAPQIAKRMMSPHVELARNDYYNITNPFFRRHRSLLNLVFLINDALCRISNLSEEKVNKQGHIFLMKIFRTVVRRFNLAPNLRLNKLAKKINRMQRPSEVQEIQSDNLHKEAIINIINEKYCDIKSVFFLNSKDFTMYEDIIGTTQVASVYSVQEDEEISSNEYVSYKDGSCATVSLNFMLTGGEILLRGKFPEDRFLSDVAVWPFVQIGFGMFGLHNVKEKIKVLMKYSNKNTIILTSNGNVDSLIDILATDYHVESYVRGMSRSLNMEGQCLNNQCVTLIISAK